MSRVGNGTNTLREAWGIFKRRPRLSDVDAREYIETWKDDPINAVRQMWFNGDRVTDNPMLKAFVDENKREVMEVLLRRIRDTDRYDDDSAFSLFDRLREIGIDWPELDIVEKSFKADDILEGSEMTRDETEKLHLRSLQTKLEYGRYGDESAEDALHYLLGVPFRDYSEPNKAILARMLRKEKKQLMRAILKTVRDVTTGSETDLDTIHPQDFWGPLFKTLEPLNLGWKELGIIKRSLDQDAMLYLKEDLGNLATLNVGPLINVLKQQIYTSRRQGSDIGPVGSKFHGYSIGSTSEIRDVGVLKKGISSLRKAFKDNEHAKGFAVYIGGHAVMFGITDPHSLAGSSRESRVAYDLTRYKDIIDRMYADNYRKPAATTARTKERYGIDRDNTQRVYVGDLIDTGKLSSMLDLIQAIGAETSQPVTAKLVMLDTEAMGKRSKRHLTKQEIESGTKDLKTRLAIYKNSKKPTVDTIEGFIATSLKNPGSSVKFAGTTYSLKASSYESINPLNLLNGATFRTSYRSTDPGSLDSLTLTYKYDRETNQLIPIKASWIDRTDPVRKYVSQEAILEPKLYLVDTLKTRKFEKDVVIPKLLQMFKDRNYYEVDKVLESLVRLGLDWPELNAIRKSLAAIEAEKKSQSQG